MQKDPPRRLYVPLRRNDPARCVCREPKSSGRRYLGHLACVRCGKLIEQPLGWRP